jgi:hypothetical protein
VDRSPRPHGAGAGPAARPQGSRLERPAIAEQDDVADGPLDDQPAEKHRPFVLAAAKIHHSRKPPKRAIATVEINPADAMAAGEKRPAETIKEPGRQPLQKQKAAAESGDV